MRCIAYRVTTTIGSWLELIQPGAIRHFPVVQPQVSVPYFCGCTTGVIMSPEKLDLLQGTLDLIVLQTLTVMGRCMAMASRAALNR